MQRKRQKPYFYKQMYFCWWKLFFHLVETIQRFLKINYQVHNQFYNQVSFLQARIIIQFIFNFFFTFVFGCIIDVWCGFSFVLFRKSRTLLSLACIVCIFTTALKALDFQSRVPMFKNHWVTARFSQPFILPKLIK